MSIIIIIINACVHVAKSVINLYNYSIIIMYNAGAWE